MAEPPPASQVPIFNLQAYSPAEIEEAIEKVGVKKANLPFLTSFMLAIVAGGGIGFGAVYYTIVASDPTLGFAATRVLGGLVFTLGLTLVLVGGAELFTGNNLIVMAWASGKVSCARCCATGPSYTSATSLEPSGSLSWSFIPIISR